MNQLYKILFFLPLLWLNTYHAQAQHKISGTVVNEKDHPIKGASVSLDNTLDGSTTDSMGHFEFLTTETGNQTVVATEVSYDDAGLPIVVSGDVADILIRMHSKKSHELGMVQITAGSFDASNDKNKTVLKPLDIVTTAGANADVVKAMETLPGTQQTGTENGLFVRGGDASEAAMLVDEMVVQNAFFSGPPGVATRSRFGAFQYEGMSFSSGGYSARYGQALSGVLELTTTNMPEKSNMNLGINMAGLYVSGTKRWKNSALDYGANYNNLTPFYGIATTNFNFYKIPVGGGGNLRYMWTPNKNGILKVNFNSTYTTSGITIPNPYYGDSSAAQLFSPFAKQGANINFVTNDYYYYSNASYKQFFNNNKYLFYTAASYSLDQTFNQFGGIPINEYDQRTQWRIEGKDFFTSRLNLLLGGEVQNYSVIKSFESYNQYFFENQFAGYSELEWTPVNFIAFRPGIRFEQSELLNQSKVSPRFSMAIKTGDHSQISFASGMFYQDPQNMYLLAKLRPGMEQATHYILNWQYSPDNRTLRIEGYYKNYSDLVLEPYSSTSSYFDPNRYRTILDTTTVNNNGHGYAKGIELFYRDKKSIKNLDYWISYSYIDTRRLYQNFHFEATPTFIANHNLSLVAKYFVDKIHTNFSATYSFASGYPYYNPTNSTITSSNFMTDHTPTFNNFALTASYLKSFGRWFSVFYFSVDNIFNDKNVFGYRYAFDASTQKYVGQPMLPALYRSFFLGANFSLSQFKKDEL